MNEKSEIKFNTGLPDGDLELKTLPDKVLRKKTRAVEKFDDRLQRFTLNMFSFMKANRGIGLAAPQVGVLYRVITVDMEGDARYLINPGIVSRSGRDETETEGCLSIPGKGYEVNRPSEVRVRGWSPEERELVFEARGLAARVLQHEIDHLNGVLICDRGEDVDES